MTIKLITFDLDNTLWDNLIVMKEADKQCYNWLLENYPKLADHYDINQLKDLKNGFQEDRPEFKHQISRTRVISIEIALEKAGYPRHDVVIGAEAAFEVFTQWRRRVSYYPGVLNVLKYLEKHYILAALTNGNIKMENLRIDRFFDFVLKAEEINSSKPDPLMYKIAMKRAGVEPEEMLHVGDSPENDILAAKSLGIQTVWFNPQNKVWEHNVNPDYAITSILELKDVVAQYGLAESEALL